MSEYYYDKHHKKWFNTMNRPDGVFPRFAKLCELDPAVVYDLRQARKTNNFMILDNRKGQKYPGIHCDFIYIPVYDLKLLTKSKDKYGVEKTWTYCAYRDEHCSSRCRFPIESILNWKKVSKHFSPDFSYVVEYVEDVSYLDYKTTDAEKMQVRARNYSELDDQCKLYYQLEGKYNFQ